MDKFTQTMTPICPLCPIRWKNNEFLKGFTSTVTLYHEDKYRQYWHCSHCKLVFVPPIEHLNLNEQKKIYDQHNNVFEDLGYQRFLGRLTSALCPKLPPKAKGLDYGCGPGPVLAQLLINLGFSMDTYDPIYQTETALQIQGYDFVTATEVIEHFTHPAEHLAQLWQHLKPGGWLGIMTKLVIDQKAFSTWHYIRDRTHVSFFSIESLGWLAKYWQTQAHFVDKDVILLQKPL